jgi:hypothetical protein
VSKKRREKWVNPVVPWVSATVEQRVLLDAAWRGGHLAFLLTPSQQDSYSKIRKWESKGEGRVFALDTSRRWGKSVLCLVLAIEDALRYPGWRIVYCAPTHDQVKKITLPLVAQLTQTCPPQLIPDWVKSDGTFVFGNGSRIEIVGLDVRPDGARGTGVDKVILDEAGFFDNLEYLMVSIIYPQMLGRDHARVIGASTPPITPMHYWSKDVVADCINKNAHDRKTLDDADQYSHEEIEAEYARMPGGRGGVAARREYGAEHIADESMQIVPEFKDAEESIVRAVEPPVWRDCYVALDPGFHDLSAVLFGYWDFLEQKLVVEDEIAEPRLNSKELATAIKAKEAKLWGNVRRRGSGSSYDTKPQPYLRISDNDLRLIADLHHDHGLAFIPTQKDNLVAQVDQVRVAMQNGQILINPRCRKLVLHLKHGVWKKVGSMFGREGGELGHFDTIAALVYLWRNVQKRRNPTPALERFVCGDMRVPGSAAQTPSKWAAEGPRLKRLGQKYYVKTGRTA